MVYRSEERPFELSRVHYASKWEPKKYAVAETNSLVIKYCELQDGKEKEDILLGLLQRFHSFFYKFLKLFVTGKMDPHSKLQKNFLGLFVTEGTKQGFTNAAKQCTIVFRSDTPDDIYNHLVVVFIQLLDLYNPNLNVGFVYYFNYFFKYYLKKYMVSKYYDAIDYQYIDSEDIADYATNDNTEGHQNGIRSCMKRVWEVESNAEEELDNTVDLLATHPGGVLKTLSPLERYIVYLLAIKGLRRSDVSSLLDLSNNKLTSIINKIKKTRDK